MAKARVIIKRRKAVRNIRKITKVMQMISTARYQKAYKRAIGTRPYVLKIGELVASATQSVKSSGVIVEHPLLKAPDASKPVAVFVISSNRGLCGGYNGNVLRLANATIRELEEAGKKVKLYVAGKKGSAFFRFQKREIAQVFNALGENPKYVEIEQVAEQFMKDYTDGSISGLKLIFMRFISAGQQRPGVVDVLPVAAIGSSSESDGKKPAQAKVETAPPAGAPSASFEFSPDAGALLEQLIPTTVKITFFQAFIEAAVSEQIARMVAMKSATDAADKLNKRLTQEYNRARQTQITSELAELMGGVEAMK